MSETEPAPEPADDLAHADVGIVCSLHREVEDFLKRCERVRKYSGGDFTFRGGKYDGIRIAVVECGVGFARARRATQALIEAHSPAWTLACGYAGGLRSETKIGHVVIANSICDTHGNQLDVDINMPADPARGRHVGRVVTSDEIVRLVKDKQALADRYEAIAVDMESLAVAQVCRDLKTRFLCVRALTDDLSADLPKEVLSVLGGTGTLRFGATVGSLFRRPSSIKDMFRLREHAHTASERLADFLDGIVTQLYQADH